MADMWRCLNGGTAQIDSDFTLFNGTKLDVVRVSVSYKDSELIRQFYIADDNA